MKNSPKIGVIFCLVTGVMALAQGCLKPEEYPDEPAIEFKFFKSFGDSGLIGFNFTDGDGDVGLGETEVSPPYDTGSQFYYNVFITYYEKVNGVWQVGKTIPGGEDIEFNYRSRLLTPNGKNKALKGEMQIFLLPVYYNPFSPDNDTIRYKIQMCDRALHLSNEVYSNEIVH
jgi:hypothetical protein